MPDKEQAKPDAIDLLLSGYYLQMTSSTGDILVANQKARDAIEALIASERATLLARLQAEVIDPAIDGDFGTVDVKVIGERLLGWVEAQLTPTEGDK